MYACIFEIGSGFFEWVCRLQNRLPKALYREKLKAGSSARTVRYIHTTLHKALKQTV
jgi:hypothetical protein